MHNTLLVTVSIEESKKKFSDLKSYRSSIKVDHALCILLQRCEKLATWCRTPGQARTQGLSSQLRAAESAEISCTSPAGIGSSCTLGNLHVSFHVLFKSRSHSRRANYLSSFTLSLVFSVLCRVAWCRINRLVP